MARRRTTKGKLRAEVLRISQGIRDYALTIDADNRLIGAALIEVGLQVALADSRAPVSAAEKKLIRAHYPKATDEDIKIHRLTPEGLGYLLSLIITFTRKYLDHQPGAGVTPDAWTDDATVSGLVSVIARNMENAYGSADGMRVSAYDVAAAVITNASILATERGVPLEQLAIIHLEGIMHALERAGPEYGA